MKNAKQKNTNVQMILSIYEMHEGVLQKIDRIQIEDKHKAN